MNKFKSLLFTSLGLLSSFSSVGKVNADDTYEIYPTVQNISYKNYNLELSNYCNVVYEGNIDEYTKQKAIEVFSSKNIKVSFTNEIDNSKNNLLLGVNHSNGVVNNYVNANINYLDSMIDAYYLCVD